MPKNHLECPTCGPAADKPKPGVGACFYSTLPNSLLPEPDEHDVREDVTSAQTLLQTQHHQKGARAEAVVQVR